MKKKDRSDYWNAIINFRTYIVAIVFAILGIATYILGVKYEQNKKYSILLSPEDSDGNKPITLDEKKDNDYEVSTILFHLSTIFGAAGIVDLIYKVIYNKSFDKKVEVILEKNVPLFRSYYEHSILGVYNKLPELEPLIKSARNEILIVQTYIPALDKYKQPIIDAFMQNPKLKLHIYILNKNSNIAEHRSKVIYHPSVKADNKDLKRIARMIDVNIDVIKDIKNYLTCINPDITICAFDFDLLPATSIYKFDNEMYVGFFMYGSEAVDRAQIKVNCTMGVGLQFKEHLDYLTSHPDVKPI